MGGFGSRLAFLKDQSSMFNCRLAAVSRQKEPVGTESSPLHSGRLSASPPHQFNADAVIDGSAVCCDAKCRWPIASFCGNAPFWSLL